MNVRIAACFACAAVLIAMLPVLAAAQLVNPDFEGGWYADGNDQIPSGWTKYETRPEENSVIGPSADNGPGGPGGTSLWWSRTNGAASGDWSTVEQELDIDVTPYACLLFHIDVKAVSHNLGGGGWTDAEWEYPVTVMIFFTDIDGIDRRWQFGWYIWWDDSVGQPVNGYITPDGNTIVYTRQVDAGVWYWETFSLIQQLSTLAVPQTITRIRVGGSGWDFEGKADNISICLVTPAMESSWGSLKALF